jgi:drug/metabolite transporter (DMT)-like permease
MYFLAMRFSLAFLVLAIFFGKKIFRQSLETWKPGVLIGLILFAGYGLQTVGLQFTTASKAGFITGLAVVLTPLMARIFLKQLLTFNTVVGAILAFLGLALLGLSGDVDTALNFGDFLVLLCAISFAGHIVAVSRYASDVEPGLLTTIQIGIVAVFCLLAAVLWETPPKLISGALWMGIFYMGIVATALVLFLQNWAQQYTSASRAALIFTLEPVFTAIFAYIILAERLSSQIFWGGGLILAGIIIAELKFKNKGQLTPNLEEN